MIAISKVEATRNSRKPSTQWGRDSIPVEIPDPKANEPDWDDAEDGIWGAPKIPNLAYKGPWKL